MPIAKIILLIVGTAQVGYKDAKYSYTVLLQTTKILPRKIYNVLKCSGPHAHMTSDDSTLYASYPMIGYFVTNCHTNLLYS